MNHPATFFRGLFEAHLHVADLEKAMRFYGDVLGLELGHMEPERRAAFYWIGRGRRTMLGLWERPPWIVDGAENKIQTQHIAFGVEFEDLDSAIQRAKQKGIEPRNFFGQMTDEPSVLAWIPAASIYFNDSDGHLLEFIAEIKSEPAPDLGVVSLTEWNRTRGA
jgi:lactoylglutathione lyase